MQNTWFTLIPPIIVLVIALVTRRIIASLIFGIGTAALIANDFNPLKSVLSIFHHITDQFKDIDTYYFFLLIFILGIIIALIIHAGGVQALGDIIIKRSKNKKGTQTSCLLLSTCLFIDDYLNSLTSGHVMRPLGDKFRIPRVKLAYLIGTMAAPLVVISPISSWVGMLIGQISSGGISLDPSYQPVILADSFFVYLQSIPFIFYSFIIIAANWFIVRRNVSFGPMHHFEKIASETGNVFGGKQEESKIIETPTKPNNSILDFLVPILTLIMCVIVGIPFVGNYYLFGGNNSLIQSFQYSNASLVLFVSSLISLSISTIFALLRKRIQFNEFTKIFKEGIQMTFGSVMIIVFALIFGSFLKQDLNTGQYLANLLLGSINVHLLPLMIYLTSTAISLSIGSSWATIAIMVPIIIPMILSFIGLSVPANIESAMLIFPCLGAIFSGSITGNHLSPISDSTVMASSSTGAHIIDLVKVRFYYVIPCMIGAATSFLLVGYLINKSYLFASIASVITGIVFSILILFLANLIKKK